MKISKLVKTLVVLAIASACTTAALALSGCSAASAGDAAATVNGEAIPESDITNSIISIRSSYGSTEDDAWKQFLKQSELTPESLRYTIINGYVNEKLLNQCSEKLDISVTDEEINEKVQSMEDRYSSKQAWEEALNKAGYENLDAYKQNIKTSLLEEKINALYTEEATTELENDDGMLLTAINESISEYDGSKKASVVLVSAENEAQAKTLREQVKNGEITMADAAKEYSIDLTSREDGGNLGWTNLATYDEAYTAQLENLKKKGDVSEVFSTANGFAFLQLTDSYKAPKTVKKTSSVPEEFVTEIKANAADSNATDKYSDWLTSMKTEQKVVVNPMPEDVPYNVDMSDVYTEAEMKEINDKAYNQLIGDTAAEEAEDATVEAVAEENGESSESAEATQDETAAETEASTEGQSDQAAEGEAGEGEAAESVENDEADSGE